MRPTRKPYQHYFDRCAGKRSKPAEPQKPRKDGMPPGYPRFRSRHNKQSYRDPQAIRLPKVGWVKSVFHRPLAGMPKNITVTKTKTGRSFVSFQVEVDRPDPQPRPGQVGIDLGLQSYLVRSNGEIFPNLQHRVKAERRLKKLQRDDASTQKGSRGREKARRRWAHQHQKVAHQRRNFQQKRSRMLTERFGIRCLEELHIQGMLQNPPLAKPIQDASWGEFVRQLGYKGAWYGSRIEPIDRGYPASKTCTDCLAERQAMPLHVRTWQCPACGTIHDRDVNAARNMARLGREQLESVGREPPKRTTPVAWVLPTLNPEAHAL